MNKTQANGTQPGGDPAAETPDDDTVADGGGGFDVEKLRRLRMMDLLRDLVRQEGKMGAAKLLRVNNKTLTRAEDSGEVTGRLSDALELLVRRADDAEVARLRERVNEMEGRLTAMASGAAAPGGEGDGDGAGASSDEDEADVPGQESATGDARAQAEGEQPDAGAGRSETRAAPQAVRLRPANPHTGRPLDPEIVTIEPADDDEEVYGDAWSLVKEWRRLREGHPSGGGTLSWLENEQRLLELELAMLEEHGLTLPPEKQPLRGFGRDGQTTHRRKALADARVALRKRQLVRWVRTVLTCWLWRK